MAFKQVGCANGVLLWSWKIESSHTTNLIVMREPTFLSGNQENSVTTLDFSPCGLYLVSGSYQTSLISVWELGFLKTTFLSRNEHLGTTWLKWSPCGQFIFQGTTGNLFVLWETKNWSHQTWGNLESHVQSATWSPLSFSKIPILTIAIEGVESIFYTLAPSCANQTIQANYLRSESLCSYRVGQDSFGGPIHAVEWDSTGECFAVSFRGDEKFPGRNLIALYSTQFSPFFDFNPKGYVRGDSSQPLIISFRPNFPHGSLLTSCWETGKITCHPIYSKFWGRKLLNKHNRDWCILNLIQLNPIIKEIKERKYWAKIGQFFARIRSKTLIWNAFKSRVKHRGARKKTKRDFFSN